MPDPADPALDEARRVLLPPLRFATQDDYARLDRLKGFGSLAAATARRLPALPPPVASSLRAIGEQFDDLQIDERKAALEELLGLLSPEGGQAPSRAAAPAEPARPRREPEPAPPPQRATPQSRPRKDAGRALSAAPSRPARDLFLEPVTVLPGIGPRRAQALSERGFATVGALLTALPRAYEDRRRIRPLSEVEAGVTCVVQGEIVAAGGGGRGGRGRYEVVIDDGTGKLKLVFFRFKLWDMKRRFTRGGRVTAVGEPARFSGQLQMVHPVVAHGARTDEMSGVWPVYSEVRGLHPTDLARAVRAAVRRMETRPLRDLVPGWVLDEVGVPGLQNALLDIHAPPDDVDDRTLSRLTDRQSQAHLRLAFDEVFVLQLALGLRRQQGAADEAPTLPGAAGLELAEELLPFAPTGAQSRAIAEVLHDVEQPAPMGRLLQGDVGAGKTAVAAVAALRAVRSGAQVAVMAPTEILAEQHHATFQKLFSPLGVRVDLFTGAAGRGKARRLKLARLHNREIQIAVGTHALLTEDVRFAHLGLCVVDEQHRFGVVQRLQLKEKGPEEKVPHTLVMTATPIPRSLALTVYGDLAVSVIDELPPGRTPVDTRVLARSAEETAYQAIDELIARGEQAYVVYPLIEESEKLDLADATRGFELLRKRFGDERVALLHGRVDAAEREAVMGRFVRGEVSVLVATTVIEVGVDVPEATCMVVKNAERFGLSQLHQLRGRVGRSAKKSRCYLIVGDDGAGKDGFRRLKVMEETTDGFRIAEEDLAIRGPGDFLGTRQHGLPTFAFADLSRHAALIEKARRIAQDVLERDPGLASPEHADLRALVFERFKERLALAGVG